MGIDLGISLQDVANFFGGMANAYGSDNLLGAGRQQQNTTAGKMGAAVGDAAATVQGVFEFGAGAGGEGGGLALDATGVGAVAGVPLNIASAGVMAHGASVTAAGFSHLAMAAMNGNSGGEVAPTSSTSAESGGGVQGSYKNVEIVDSKGSPLGEFDEIKNNTFIEDKSAKGLDTVNPRTGQPAQTADQWAQKQIFDKTSTRIQNLGNAAATRPAGGSTSAPSLDQIKNIRSFDFRIESSTPEVKAAVENQLQALRQKFPGWTFNATFGH